MAFSRTSGRADQVLYEVAGVWIMGGSGVFRFTGVRPVREYGQDDLEIAQAAPVGSPCTVWFEPNGGGPHLIVWLEKYATEDC